MNSEQVVAAGGAQMERDGHTAFACRIVVKPRGRTLRSVAHTHLLPNKPTGHV